MGIIEMNNFFLSLHFKECKIEHMSVNIIFKENIYWHHFQILKLWKKNPDVSC